MNALFRFITISLAGSFLVGFSVTGTSATTTDGTQLSIQTTKHGNEYHIETGHEISGIAVIPASGHRGSAKLAVAHGNTGATLYNFDGTVLWHDATPARLIGFYQNALIIYRDHEESTRLDTYSVTAQGAVSFQSTAAPSPIAATTIQRTAFSLVGPVQLRKNIVVMGDKEIEMPESVLAFAAAKIFIPLTNAETHVFALKSGKIIIKNGE